MKRNIIKYIWQKYLGFRIRPNGVVVASKQTVGTLLSDRDSPVGVVPTDEDTDPCGKPLFTSDGGRMWLEIYFKWFFHYYGLCSFSSSGLFKITAGPTGLFFSSKGIATTSRFLRKSSELTEVGEICNSLGV